MDKAKALNECEPQATHEFSALPVRRTQRAGAYATASLVRPNLYWEDRVNQLNKKENKNMLVQKDYKFWFCTGSQDLYGDECLAHVAEHSQIIVKALNESGILPY